jgi:hypothetical protein
MAHHVANQIRDSKVDTTEAAVHVSAAVPDSLLFFLGQQHSAIAPCVVYGFDIDRQGK